MMICVDTLPRKPEVKRKPSAPDTAIVKPEKVSKMYLTTAINRSSKMSKILIYRVSPLHD